MFGLSQKLRIYTVHVKPSERWAEEAPMFVAEGFSLMAFIFTGLWAVFHQLWWVAAVIIGFNVVTYIGIEWGMLSAQSMVFLNLFFNFWIGAGGNDWLRRKYKKRGYVMSDIVSGETVMRAEQRYFDKLVSHHAPLTL